MLYIHGGTVKTGSTYIQKTLYDNREIFSNLGLIYMPVHPEDLQLPRYANAKFLYDASLADEAMQIINTNSNHKVIVSEEGIFGYIEHLKNPIFKTVEKKIIIYVRPAAELLAAWAAEFSNPYNVIELPDGNGFHPTRRRILSVPDALDVASHEYSISLSRFMNIVNTIGREKFIIRPYDRSSFERGDLLTDFLSQLGFDADAARSLNNFKEPRDINPTNTRKFCDVSHIIWHKIGRPNELSFFNQNLINLISASCVSGDDRPVIETLSDNQIDWFTARLEHFENFLSLTFTNGKPFFKRRFPECYQNGREAYRPVDPREVELLTDLYQLRRQF